ncbi:MAG: MFS transporter [Paracoccaceae bacterium]|nr:MFS transporter [Paracoccaceae bacterium]
MSTGSGRAQGLSWREFLGEASVASLSLVCMAVWIHAADSLVVATMLPRIVAEIGGAAYVGWTVSLYQIGSIVLGAASALVTLRFGLRLPMSVAALTFGLGCAFSAMAPSMGVVLIGRTLQGLGGGGLVSMSFIAASLLFERRHIARVMATISALWGVSAFLGPLLGGLFVQYATWRIGFWFFAVEAMLLAGLILWTAPRHQHVGSEGSFPVVRLALLSAGVVLVSEGGVVVAPLRTGVLVLAGLVCLALFFLSDARATASRLLPRAPLDLRHPTGAALVMIMAMSMATIAGTAYGPILLVRIHGLTALEAGYVVAASSLGWTLTAVLVSGAPERMDRALIAAGMIVVALGLVLMVWAMPSGSVWLVALAMAAMGGGFGLSWTFILRRSTGLAEGDEVQRISGAIPVLQRLGYALGAAAIGIVANASGFLSMHAPAEAAHAARAIFAACLIPAALALIAMLTLVRR